MNDRHYLLAEVARILGRKPHHISYALTTRQVPEPHLRVANKRVFSAEDVERLARHFGVNPRWPSPNSTGIDEHHRDNPVGMLLTPPFEVGAAGESCHEVRDGDGIVFCWASDRAKALLIAGLLESAVRG